MDGGTMLKATDSFEKVVSWYKNKLSAKKDFKEITMPSRGESDKNQESRVGFSFKSGETTKMVMISKNNAANNEETLIMIGEASEQMPSSSSNSQNI